MKRRFRNPGIAKKVVGVTNAKIFDGFDKVFKIQIPTKNDADPKRVIDTFSKR